MPSPPRVNVALTERELWVVLQAIRNVSFPRPEQLSTVARLNGKCQLSARTRGWDMEANPFEQPQDAE